MVPSESAVPAELKDTASGPLPELGVAATAAVGKTFRTRCTSTVVECAAPSLSVTVRLAT